MISLLFKFGIVKFSAKILSLMSGDTCTDKKLPIIFLGQPEAKGNSEFFGSTYHHEILSGPLHFGKRSGFNLLNSLFRTIHNQADFVKIMATVAVKIEP